MSQFGLATFQVVSSHMRLAPTLLFNIELYCNFSTVSKKHCTVLAISHQSGLEKRHEFVPDVFDYNEHTSKRFPLLENPVAG